MTPQQQQEPLDAAGGSAGSPPAAPAAPAAEEGRKATYYVFSSEDGKSWLKIGEVEVTNSNADVALRSYFNEGGITADPALEYVAVSSRAFQPKRAKNRPGVSLSSSA